MLSYAERYYERQFITRKIVNHQILIKLEEVLDDFFNNENTLYTGVPTVKRVAQRVNLSPNYLSSMLKVITGQSTQQHIHNKLIEKAKETIRTYIRELVNDGSVLIGSSRQGYFKIKPPDEANQAIEYLQNRIPKLEQRINELRKAGTHKTRIIKFNL